MCILVQLQTILVERDESQKELHETRNQLNQTKEELNLTQGLYFMEMFSTFPSLKLTSNMVFRETSNNNRRTR
jgi:hypothetical protein